MAHKKAAGSTKNGRDSGPQYLGIKINHGEKARTGMIIVRQRGSEFLPGKNVKSGKDRTLFAGKEGVVSFGSIRKTRFNGKAHSKKVVHVM